MTHRTERREYGRWKCRPKRKKICASRTKESAFSWQELCRKYGREWNKFSINDMEEPKVSKIA